MREILFRGKRVENGEWVEGYFVNATDAFLPNEAIVSFIIESDSMYFGYGEFTMANKVIPETVCQFTGLTDKNGKKIFEGDIGRYQQTDGARQNNKPIICIGKVIYNAKTASFAVESKDEKEVKYFDYFPVKDFEIIGNIHDNPELLKGGADNG